MLTPEYLAGFPDSVVNAYEGLRVEIEADIARRLAKTDYTKISDTAAWQIEKLQQLGASREYIAEKLSRASHHKRTTAEVTRLFNEAGVKATAPDEALRKAMLAAGKPAPGIPLQMTPALAQVMQANLTRTLGTLTKLTGTMAQDATGKLNKYLDHAQLMVQSGAFTVQDATDNAVRKFAAEGVGVFDYASGATTSVEAAVRRALITGINQAAGKISEANAQLLGTDLVEVTSHADARPEHAEWQGKVYSLSGAHTKYRSLAEATGYGTGAGLCGWNCRHSFYAFVEGVSETLPKEKYSEELYQAEQKQRYNERQIRKWKRRANTLQAGGVDPAPANKKVKYWQGIQRAHVSKYDLSRLYGREKVYGLTETPRKPRMKVAAPTPEEIAKAKIEAKKASERERVRVWRAKKKAEAAMKAEAEKMAREATEKAAREAAAIEAKKASERERVRRWREAKKAEGKTAAASKLAAEKAAKEAADKAAKEAAEKASLEPIKAYSDRIGQPGTYEAYRRTDRGVPTDGITAFHSTLDKARAGTLTEVKSYDITTVKPLFVEADNILDARNKAFRALTGENPATFPGDKGKAVAKAMRAQGYDSLVYKFPGGTFEIDPIDFAMAKKSAAEVAAEKAAAAKAAKAAAAKAKADAIAKAANDKLLAEKAKLRAMKGLPDRTVDGKIPPTLENFETIRDHKLKSVVVDDDALKAKESLQQMADKAVVRSRIDQYTMEYVIKDDQLKTQIALAADKKKGSKVAVTSGGMNDPETRKKASGKLFGTDIKKTDPYKYEYYGYIWDDDFITDFIVDGPDSYGASTLQMKPGVKTRTTFTMGDSLGNGYIPSYLDDVTPNWGSDYGKYKDALAAHSKNFTTIEAVYRDAGAHYFEAQMHGGVSLADVESFIIGPNDFRREGINKKVAKYLDSKGIKVGLIEKDQYGDPKALRWLTEEDWK